MDRGIKRLLVALILGLGISTGMVLTMNALPGRTQAQLQDPSPVNPTQDSSHWVISTVDAYRTSGVGPRSSFALDSSGTPHFAYLGVIDDSVKYAVLSGTTWISETIVTHASFPRLAVDGSGTPHIVYWRPWPLYYAVRRDNRWITEVVDMPCTSPVLVLDSSDNPHVISNDIRPLEVGGEGLKYAHRTASKWVTGSIEKVKGPEPSGKLALDGSDIPHVVHVVAPDARLKYAVLSGTTWISETVEISATTPSLALDSSGGPRIAYTHLGSRVSYAVLSGTAWVTKTIEQYATSPSLVLDGSGSPHIAYVHRDSYLSYAYLNGSTWVTETVDQAAGGFSFALDSLGIPHIAYCSGQGLEYAHRTVFGWTSEGVDGVACGSPELALDDSGSPHIGYHDTARHDIKYARLAASGCSFTVFNDDFDGNKLDPGRWDAISGTPVVSGGWLTLSGGEDIQSKCGSHNGTLQGVIRSSNWKPYGEFTDSSFGFEIWTGNNGRCHYGILFKANGHLAVLSSQPDANGNCFGDPSYQAYLRLSNWDAVRAGGAVSFRLGWCLDSATLDVSGNGQEGQASYLGQAVPAIPMKIRLYVQPPEAYEIDYIRSSPCLYLPIVMYN